MPLLLEGEPLQEMALRTITYAACAKNRPSLHLYPRQLLWSKMIKIIVMNDNLHLFDSTRLLGKLLEVVVRRFGRIHTHPAAFYRHLSVINNSNDRLLTCASSPPPPTHTHIYFQVCLPDVKSHDNCRQPCTNTRLSRPATTFESVQFASWLRG